MVEEGKYNDWTEHPRWKELWEIWNKIANLKREAQELRALIKKEVFGD